MKTVRGYVIERLTISQAWLAAAAAMCPPALAGLLFGKWGSPEIGTRFLLFSSRFDAAKVSDNSASTEFLRQIALFVVQILGQVHARPDSLAVAF